ncbi:Ashwin [Merluccius polli]|uniref:Ashwin n=1 Tax=Merluccius polli TaxID=89951 RepID=A0AA47MUJ9_MERPO|nr:Ashwin [Merluccius polli]
MAASVGRESAGSSAHNADLLLHPELLSQDFMQLLLNEVWSPRDVGAFDAVLRRNIRAAEGESRDRLTSLYLRHVIPLPQRQLPDTRWGRRVEERSRGGGGGGGRDKQSAEDHHRKRPLIVFDGVSNPAKVKKTDVSRVATGCADRLKPPPTAATNLSNPIRKLSSSSPHTTPSSQSSVSGAPASSLKRESDSSDALKSPEIKKKIHHVTWP